MFTSPKGLSGMGKAQLVTLLQFWLSNHPRLLTIFLFDQTLNFQKDAWFEPKQPGPVSFFFRERCPSLFLFLITLLNIIQVSASKPKYQTVFVQEKHSSKPVRIQRWRVSVAHLIIFYVNKLNKLWQFLWNFHINYLLKPEWGLTHPSIWVKCLSSMIIFKRSVGEVKGRGLPFLCTKHEEFGNYFVLFLFPDRNVSWAKIICFWIFFCIGFLWLSVILQIFQLIIIVSLKADGTRKLRGIRLISLNGLLGIHMRVFPCKYCSRQVK